jgi:ergothioneine biosynthesis protein EgtB
MTFVHTPAGSSEALLPTLRARLADARRRTDALFDLVRPGALLDRPIPARHRILFYLGHLEAFDANLLLRDSLGRDPFNEGFDHLFAFGIDPVEGGLPRDAPGDWPAIEEVRAYDARARAGIDAALTDGSIEKATHANLREGWALALAIEHRLMHAETLAYMLHELPYDAKVPGPAPGPGGDAPQRALIEIPAGRATLGMERGAGPGLGWDNEYEAHVVHVPAFAIESHDVTCADFLSFLREGGYQARALWDEDGWRWRCEAGITRPLRWRERNGAWFYRGMFAEAPLSPAWPVYVSYAEAAAYARWRGRSLPTEAQYHRAAYGSPRGGERAYPWGDTPPAERHGVFGFSAWDPAAVGSHPAGDSAFGVADLVGNGWEWTSTPFAPFPGFEPLPFYRGYSANFFDGRHYVMKGGGPRTEVSLLRRSFRNWFQPHYPYPDAAFRCVETRE